MAEINRINGYEADRDPDAYTDDRLLGRIRARFARAAALHSEFEKAQAENDRSLAGAQWGAGIAQTETASAALGSSAVCMVGPPPDTWRVVADRMWQRMTVAGKRPAPLSASWHHLPCVTAGAVPPARAEEPIWRALRQGGR